MACRLSLILFVLVFTVAIVWSHSANAAGEVCTADGGGANDQNQAQSDLTQLCVDYDDAAVGGTYDASIHWDKDGFNGNNTGDACLMFDTSFDSQINYVLCVSVGDKNPPVLQSGPTLYSCANTHPDRCPSPVLLPITGSTSCTVGVENNDPFPAGEDFPFDSVARCTVDIDDIPAGSLQVNSCSYPSTNPNADPKDCVIETVSADMSITKTDGLTFYPAPLSSVTYNHRGYE